MVITSAGFAGELFPFDDTNTFTMEPWSFVEYKRALGHKGMKLIFKKINDLDPTITKKRFDEFVERKYFFSGISARFFFELSISQIMDVVMNALERVPSWEGLARKFFSPRSPSLVQTQTAET